MIKQEKLFEFHIFDKLLKKSMSSITAAEAHGILIAYICMENKAIIDFEKTILNILDLKQNKKIVVNFINQICIYNSAQIKEINGIVSLMLPNKDENLTLKIKCLQLWLKGFISGLGLFGIDKQKYGIPAVYEILNDFLMITHMQHVDNTENQDDESYYIDLVEYIKVSVEIIYFEVSKFKKM